MKTKPIDYTGCHPKIAAELKKDKAVWCKCWDTTEPAEECWVYTYVNSDKYPYRAADDDYINAEPIEPKYRVKDPVSLMQALMDSGYKPNTAGHFVKKFESAFNREMWQYCGEEVDEDNIIKGWKFLPEWCEEVDE